MRHTPHKSNGYTHSSHIKAYYSIASIFAKSETERRKNEVIDYVGYRLTTPDIEIRI